MLQPGVLLRHLQALKSGYVANPSNRYLRSHSRDEELAFAAALLSVAVSEVDALASEIETDSYLDALRDRYRRVRPETEVFDIGRFRIWYAAVRALQPAVVVETGVHDGLSSAVILRALERNNVGRLVSIDLPSSDLPPRADGPGWLVPHDARERWTLHLGDSRVLLPQLAEVLAPIDVFIHDSDHSHEHQTFEYACVRPHLAQGALVLSDQDYPDELPLSSFATQVHGTHRRVQSLAGTPGNYIGGVRLPTPTVETGSKTR